MQTIIYGLCDRGGCVRYVGKTQQHLQKRFRNHIVRARCGEAGHKNNWIRKCLASGYKPTVMLIATVDGDGIKEEMFHIAQYRRLGVDLTNKTDGGEGAIGYKPTPETLEKLRSSHLGKTPSKETVEKLSLALIGRKKSLVTRERMRKAQFGSRPSDECFEAAWAGSRGRKHTEEELIKMRRKRK